MPPDRVPHERALLDYHRKLTYAVKLGAGIAAGDDDVVWVDGLVESYAMAYWAEGVERFSAGVSKFRPEVGLELFDALGGRLGPISDAPERVPAVSELS